MEGWKRTFWVVFAANVVTSVGMMSFLPFFPSLLAELGLEDRDEIGVWAGVLFGAAPLAAAFMGPLWGSLGDRYGRKLMVARAMLAITFFVGAMGFARTPWQLLGLRLGQGVFSGFIPPSITLVSIAAPRDAQGRVTGTLQTSLAIGAIVGPLVGALFQSTLGIRWVFFFVSAASAVSALTVLAFAREDASLRTTLAGFSPTALLAGTWSDLSELLAKPRVRNAILLLFAVQFGVGATNPLLELFVADVAPGSPELVAHRTSVLFTSLAIASLIAAPLWGRYGDRIGHARVLFRSSLSSAVALLLNGASAGYALLLASRCLLGMSASGSNAASFGIAATETAEESRGSAFGAIFSARAFALSIGAMCGGLLASWIGIRSLFLLSGLATLGALVLLRPRPRRPRADPPG